MRPDRRAACAITVAICSRNRCASLLVTLDSLERQEWDGRWEVLVVDNGSEDETCAVIRGRAADFPVPLRVIAEPQLGLSFARNRAAHEARGRVLLFIDDDVSCLSGWLAAHAFAFEDPRWVGSGGRILPVLPPEAPAWWKEILPSQIGGPTARYDFGSTSVEIVIGGPMPAPFGANMGILRQWVLALGGFRTDLGWGRRMIPAEESEFFQRVRAQGGRLRYVPDASVEHRIAPDRLTLDYYTRWQQGKGRSRVILAPPPGPMSRLAAIATCLVGIGAAAIQAQRPRAGGDFTSGLAAVCKRERRKGRFYELVGL